LPDSPLRKGRPRCFPAVLSAISGETYREIVARTGQSDRIMVGPVDSLTCGRRERRALRTNEPERDPSICTVTSDFAVSAATSSAITPGVRSDASCPVACKVKLPVVLKDVL